MAFAGHTSSEKPARYWLYPNGMTVGRCEMTLGLNAKKKRALALPHLTEARRKVPTWMLARIDAALAELA